MASGDARLTDSTYLLHAHIGDNARRRVLVCGHPFQVENVLGSGSFVVEFELGNPCMGVIPLVGGTEDPDFLTFGKPFPGSWSAQ